MIIRSKAPLRIGLAGGGSDVSPYSDKYGGAILNATIDLYAYATIEPRNDNKIVLKSMDLGEQFECESEEVLEANGKLMILKGIYNRIVKEFTHKKLSFTLTTYVEAPPGSGLGSSSTLVTTIIGAFVEWLKLPLGEYDIARLAYEIERIDLQLAGGKQDQYAATFGGVNYMEFYDNDKVIVNPLRIRSHILSELSYCTVLYFTGKSRYSSEIIERQQNSVLQNEQAKVEAMHLIKKQAVLMKEALLKGELDAIGPILDFGWKNKKKMAAGISSNNIDNIYNDVMAAGATGGKVSGAGGGGFMFFYCPKDTKYKVIDVLHQHGGTLQHFNFSHEGLVSWTV